MASRRGTDVGLRKRLRPARRLRKRTPPYATVFLTVGRDCSGRQCSGHDGVVGVNVVILQAFWQKSRGRHKMAGWVMAVGVRGALDGQPSPDRPARPRATRRWPRRAWRGRRDGAAASKEASRPRTVLASSLKLGIVLGRPLILAPSAARKKIISTFSRRDCCQFWAIISYSSSMLTM